MITIIIITIKCTTIEYITMERILYLIIAGNGRIVYVIFSTTAPRCKFIGSHAYKLGLTRNGVLYALTRGSSNDDGDTNVQTHNLFKCSGRYLIYV